MFANTTDDYAGAKNALDIPTILLSQQTTTNIIDGEPGAIYVKKVGAEGAIESIGREKVQFKINRDANYTPSNYFGKSSGANFPLTSLLSHTKLTSLITATRRGYN